MLWSLLKAQVGFLSGHGRATAVHLMTTPCIVLGCSSTRPRSERQLSKINVWAAQVQPSSQCTRLAADSIVPRERDDQALKVVKVEQQTHSDADLLVKSSMQIPDTALESTLAVKHDLTARLAVPAAAAASPGLPHANCSDNCFDAHCMTACSSSCVA
jgi:hypothetical protein